ncbi:hypothetical protein AVEN_225911-1 [Araneus ventricosus]|uniref:Tc1-like transposase DDE domain-containing protein n=1 Tax=Araneus ventricosus TaxID=182803 RepID=A0A4Y2BD36_ARAVE|nr:hypothetical protein AVEN_225911-1 [Araneus ventricosus]
MAEYLWMITPAHIEHDWCGVSWRVKPFHRWRGLPYLNQIEHVWDMLGRRIAGRSVPPGTFHELQEALLQKWASLPQRAINDAIASMPRRYQSMHFS